MGADLVMQQGFDAICSESGRFGDSSRPNDTIRSEMSSRTSM